MNPAELEKQLTMLLQVRYRDDGGDREVFLALDFRYPKWVR